MKLVLILALSLSTILQPCNDSIDSCITGSHTNEIVLQPGPYDANCGYVSYLETDPSWAEGTNYNKPLTYMEMPSCAWITDGFKVSRSYFSFNLKDLPKELRIKSAKLSLYGIESSNTIVQGNQGENELLIQRVLDDWEQESLTWNHQPSTTTEGQIELPASNSTWNYHSLNIDVTAMVDAMINQSPGQTAGFCLRLKNEKPDRSMLFASSKHPDPSKRPRLTITLEDCLDSDAFVLNH